MRPEYNMAADKHDPGRRASLLEMAQAWRTLARQDGRRQDREKDNDNDNDKQ
jgi:hypothetical protein